MKHVTAHLWQLAGTQEGSAQHSSGPAEQQLGRAAGVGSALAAPCQRPACWPALHLKLAAASAGSQPAASAFV